MSAQTVLVTGAAGFLGSTLVDRLLAEGRRVVGVDDLSTGVLSNLDSARRLGAGSFEFQRADVGAGGLDAVVARHRPEVVVHLAARVPSNDPVADAAGHVLGAVTVLEAARRHGVRKVVHAADAARHGDPGPHDLVGDDVEGPATTAHGAAMRAVEEYLRAGRAAHGVRWTQLVLGEVYGPRELPGRPGSVATMVDAMTRGRPVELPGDGEREVDLVFVDDVVHALALAMDHGDGVRCNIGTGRATSQRRLFTALDAALGHGREPLSVAAEQGAPARLALSHHRATETLGWKPWTTLEEGLAATLRAAGALVGA